MILLRGTRPIGKKRASLYLYSSEWNDHPPICHGGTGVPIPTYLFPLDDDVKEKIYYWYSNYAHLISLWFHGYTEIPSYRQLAEPNSLFAEEGRQLCGIIEKVTGIPTYYHLMRYWGRRKGEEDRRCPLCGGKWFLEDEKERKRIDEIDFRCEKCRLVSALANTHDDQRHACIGEYRKPRKK